MNEQLVLILEYNRSKPQRFSLAFCFDCAETKLNKGQKTSSFDWSYFLKLAIGLAFAIDPIQQN